MPNKLKVQWGRLSNSKPKKFGKPSQPLQTKTEEEEKLDVPKNLKKKSERWRWCVQKTKDVLVAIIIEGKKYS